jgi:hypothetical protein
MVKLSKITKFLSVSMVKTGWTHSKDFVNKRKSN